MFTNYLKIAIRNFLRQKAISAINVFGLSVSLAATLLLVQYIRHELSYDTFHENKDRIYRIVSNVKTPDGESLVAPVTAGEVAMQMTNRVSHIDKIIQIEGFGNSLKYNENVFREITILRADKDFFNIFSFNALDGDPIATLSRPNEVAITQSVAKRVFGDKYPIGKTVEINRTEFEVTAILEDVPSNSHMRFDALTSFLDIEDLETYLSYRGLSSHCYFTTHLPIQSKDIEQDIVSAADQIVMARMARWGINVSNSIQQLQDIHLGSSNFRYDIGHAGDRARIYLFSFIALLLFVIAVINFVNLIVARSETRAREVGLRKVCGAFRKHIIMQFLGEAILLSLISVILALVLAEIFLPFFGNLVETQITLTLFTPKNILLVLVLGVVTGFVAGLYPSFFLSRYTTQRAFKGEQGKKRGLSSLQISLVVVQFTIAVFLIACLINVFRQVSYLKEKDLGFRSEVYALDNLTHRVSQGFQSVKNELERLPGVLKVSGSQSVPGRQSTLQNVQIEGQGDESSIIIQQNRIQDGYLETLGIPVIQGRDFNPNLASDSAAFILNQTAVRALGLENPLGVRIRIHNLWGEIIGITPDYHTRSLHGAIEPLAHSREEPELSYIVMNIDMMNARSTIDAINATIKDLDPQWDVSGRFINEYFDGQYRREEKLNVLYMAASILSIVIAVMGLFALANFTTIRRTKEVGIRKTLGATTPSISFVLAWDLIRWVFLSCIIALPLAWYAMDKYLLNFAYRIKQEPWVFVLAVTIGVVLALATVIGQTIRIARENPIKALRYE